MSQTFYALERLELPFRTLAERSMLIAEEGRHVQTGVQKIVLILGGECRHAFQGESSRILSTGDVLIAPCRTEQFYQPLEGEANARLHNIVLTFDPYSAPLRETPASIRKSEDFEAHSPQEFLEKSFTTNVHHQQVLSAPLMEIVGQIRHEANLRLPGFRWRISSLCAGIVILLARGQDEIEAIGSPTEARRGVLLVGSAKEYLTQHLADEVHLPYVAEHLQVSSGHLARTFKRVAGQSLFSYLRQMRLEQAKLRLLDTQQSVTTIAEQCGFSSTTLFCRNFKQYTGLTPLAYRDGFGADSES